MEQTHHEENHFPKAEQKSEKVIKNKPMSYGVIALVVIAAGIIWYISDTSTSAPEAQLPVQQIATNTAPAPAPQTISVPLANTADLPAVEMGLSGMEANLKTIDDLKDI